MEKSLLNATKEEQFDFSTKLHLTLAKLLAHQNGMENPVIKIKYEGKEIKKC